MFTLSAKKYKTWSLIATGTDSSQTLAGRLERLPTVRVLTNLVQTGEGFRERKSLKKRTTAAAQCTIYMGQSMTLMPCTCRFSHAHASRAAWTQLCFHSTQKYTLMEGWLVYDTCMWVPIRCLQHVSIQWLLGTQRSRRLKGHRSFTFCQITDGHVSV